MNDLSRVEQLLRNALGEDIYEVTPQSRVEVLLQELNELIEGLDTSVSPEDIATAVSAYLDEHLTNPTSPPVDTSLAIAGAAADAKKTGDEIGALKEDLNNKINPIISKITGESISIGWIYDKYINTNKTTGTVIDPSASATSANYAYNIIPVNAGEVYTLTGSGGNDPRLWALTDTNYALLSKSDANVTLTNAMFSIESDGYLIINVKQAEPSEVIRNLKVNLLKESEIHTEQIEEIQNNVYSKNIKSGVQVIVDDAISKEVTIRSNTSDLPVSHSSKNILSYPFAMSGDTTTSGLTFSTNSDGVVHVTGTSTSLARYPLVGESNRRELKAGTYTFSGCPSIEGSLQPYLMLSGVGQGQLEAYENGETFTISEDKTYYLYIYVPSGLTVDFYVYPQIEHGATKTSWEKYQSETIIANSVGVKSRLFGEGDIFNASVSFDVEYYVAKIFDSGSIFDITDFGAVGDGVTDDTDAIQNAFNQAQGRTIFIPEGEFLFSETLYIKAGTRILGAGEKSVLKLADDFTLTPYPWRTGDPLVSDQFRYPMIIIESTESGCMLENFKLEGQTAQFYDKNCDGLSVFGSNHVLDNLVVENINCFPTDFESRVNNGVGYGVRIAGNTITVRNCKIFNCGYECLGFEDADTATITDCDIGYACQTGLQVHRNCNHIHVINNNIHCYQPGASSYRPGLTFHASSEYPMKDIIVTGNYTGSSFVFANGGAENDIRIVNNMIDANILTNDFSTTVSSYRNNWIIMGNYIAGLVQAKCNNLIIKDNIIKSNSSPSHTMIRAITNKYIINDNLAIGTYSDIEINGEIVV